MFFFLKMDKLFRSRGAARGWLTRTASDLEEVLNSEEIDLFELTELVKDFEKRINNLDSIQGEIEEHLDLEDLDKNIEEAHEFRKKYRTLKVKADSVLSSLRKNNRAAGSDIKNLDSTSDNQSVVSLESNRGSGHRSNDNYLHSARLPKLEIPKFSGNYLEYFSFCDRFDAVVDGSDLPPVTKFTYLQSLLTGEALSSIKGLTITDQNYRVAREILQNRYGRKERIIFEHIQRLLNLPTNPPNNLWVLYNELQTHIRCLDNLDVSEKTYGVILTPLILSRIPNDIRLEWARKGEGKESDLSFLMNFLYDEIKTRERSQTFSGTKNSKQSDHSNDHRRPRPSVASFHTGLEEGMGIRTCGLCNRNNHKAEHCYALKTMVPSEIFFN